jgi:hypothetical protein
MRLEQRCNHVSESRTGGPKFAGAYTDVTSEQGPEVFGIQVAHTHPDLKDACIRMTKHLLRSLHTARGNVLMWSNAG